MDNVKLWVDNIEECNELIQDWDLDFRLLSRNNFEAHLDRFSTPSFSITKAKLQGNIEQKGTCPQKFTTIAIPVYKCQGFHWLNHWVQDKQLVIFPENGIIDAVSFNHFHVYVVSIEREILDQQIDLLGFDHCKRIFNGKERVINVEESFLAHFSLLADDLLSGSNQDQIRFIDIINKLHFILLKAIEYQGYEANKLKMKKSAKGLKLAVDTINTEKNQLLSIPHLCEVSGLSERALQYAFKDKYQVGPLEYLKSVRLHRVKKELYKLREQKPIISSIAREHHFWHMGEFSKDFKNKFGILPSQLIKSSN